jgi:hypothetical protein
MNIKQARELEREYNEAVRRGKKLYEEIEPIAARCNAIIQRLRIHKVDFDEITLLFGGELQINVVGKDEDVA